MLEVLDSENPGSIRVFTSRSFRFIELNEQYTVNT